MFLNIKSQLPPGTKLWANWMGWFNGADGKKHMANVCQSDDPRTIRNQVLAAHAVGIDGFVVDHYGPPAKDFALPTAKATEMLAKELANLGMEISIMVDSGAFKYGSGKQGQIQLFNDEMKYLRTAFFPLANYSKINGKPIVWEFAWSDKGIDPANVAKNNPDLMILTRNRLVPGCGGSFAWVTVNKPQEYLHNYLAQKDAVMIPCLFDMFDDHDPALPANSRWGGPARIMNPAGQWQMCLDEIKKASDAGKKFPAVQICTWNDHDERTQIESQAVTLAGLKLF